MIIKSLKHESFPRRIKCQDLCKEKNITWVKSESQSHTVISDSLRLWTIALQAPLSMWILQATILEWVARPSSRGSSQPWDWTQVSHTAGGFFTVWATRKAHVYWSGYTIPSPRDLPDPGIEMGFSALQADSSPLNYQERPSVNIV